METFMHTRHKSGHLETLNTLHTLLTPHGKFCIPLTCIFVNFVIVITILLLFEFASPLPSSPQRVRQDDSENLGIRNFFIYNIISQS